MSIEILVARPSRNVTEDTPWGRLTWMVSGQQGNSKTMTVGRCLIRPGFANPRHHHPNCDEVLHVLQGTIAHSVGDEMVEMTSGDAISIPQGAVHNARNVGSVDAILLIVFSSPRREVVGE